MGLSMIRMPVDVRALRIYATMTRTGDDDGCYALHHAMRKRWGDTAPQPFHAVLSGPEPHVVGYMEDPEALKVVSHDPHLEAIFPEGTLSRPVALPEIAGGTYSFRVRTRPLIRYGKRIADMIEKETGRRPFPEMCAVQATRLRTGEDVDTTEVCRGWLEKRLEGAATLATFSLLDYVAQPVLRSTHGPAGPRTFPGSTAVMTGTIVIDDPTAFATLIAKGIGRHAAFGYGLMLIAPAAVPARLAA